MIKSPLRYPGGKSRAVKYLIKFLPEFNDYREPFFGGGSLGFYISQVYKKVNVEASDINYDLYCFWQQLKANHTQLVEKVAEVFADKKDGRKLYNDLMQRRHEKLDPIERASDFFILNRITFSGVVDAGGYSEASFNSRFTQSSIDRLNSAAEVAKRMNFHHRDYSYLTEMEGKDVFIFFDPPYYSVSKSRLYGKKGSLHTSFDHNKFADIIKGCKHKWLITYDNSEFIQDLFKDYYQVKWELQYGMNNYKQQDAAKGKELLIANYDLEAMLKN